MDKFSKIITSAREFIEKQKGQWDHFKWQGFLDDVQNKGIDLTKEMQDYLGLVLESMNKFYSSLPLTAKEVKEEPEATEAPKAPEVPKAPELLSVEGKPSVRPSEKKAVKKAKTPGVTTKKKSGKTAKTTKKAEVKVTEPQKAKEPSRVKKQKEKKEDKGVNVKESLRTTKKMDRKRKIAKKPLAKKSSAK